MTASVSDVQLAPADFCQPRPARLAGPWTMIAVGSLERAYKGHHVLLDALAHLRAAGVEARLDLVGEGRLGPALRARAQALGLDGVVTFHGHVPSRDGLRSLLDRADVFVMPSLTEGLPRALLEAMARGLPAVVSDVGGMPDVVAPDLCVPAGDARALASTIAALVSDPARTTAAGARNHELAQSFTARSQQVAMQGWLHAWAGP